MPTADDLNEAIENIVADGDPASASNQQGSVSQFPLADQLKVADRLEARERANNPRRGMSFVKLKLPGMQ